MRLLTTAILGVAVLVLSVIIYMVDHEEETGSGAAEMANVLLRYSDAAVAKVEVFRGDQRVLIEKKEATWFFMSPEVDRVDSGSVSVLLDQLNHLEVLDQISPEEMSNDSSMSNKSLGFSPEDAIRLVLTEQKGKDGGEERTQELLIGGPTPRANTVYAKLPGSESEGVFVVDGNPRKLLEDPLKAMRDRRILAVPVEAIVQMVIRDSKSEVALQRKITPPVTPWGIVRPIETWADRDRLDELLASLSGMLIDEVIEGSSGDDQIPNPIPENAVVVQLAVFGMETPLTLYLKQLPKEEGDIGPPIVEVRISDRPWTYRMRSQVVASMPRSAEGLRNRALANISLQSLDSIVIQSVIDPLVYLKSDRQPQGIAWDVKINNKLVPANLSEITKLVQGINETSILDFVSDSADDISEYGLDPPARKVTFQVTYPGAPDADGKPGPSRQIVRALKMGWKEGDEQRLFVNFDGEPYVYEVDPTFANLFPTHPIRWRSLKVLSFNPFHLKSISRELPGKESLKLKYDYTRDQWTAFRSDVEVTSSLDVASARKLRDRLGAFTASGWYLSLGQAYEALEKPLARFKIVTSELDPATNERKDKSYILKLAPSLTDVYFGQIEGAPDVFFVNRETYRNLIQPVTVSRIQPSN